MKHIVVAVTNDLMTDQRVDRTCRTLAQAGYGVTLIGRRLPTSVPLPRRVYRMVRMRLLFRRSALFYAEYNLRLMLRLLVSRADAFYANDSDTLPACALVSRIRRKPLLFDAHELFPEVPELVGRPRVQAVWRWVERHTLPQVTAAFTVCQSVADEYRSRYGVTMRVMRNFPESSTEPSNRQTTPPEAWLSSLTTPHILLYQGAVNVGRGVRESIDALEWLPDCTLVVAGDGDELSSLQRYAGTLPWQGRIVFLGRVDPPRMRRLTRCASLGLCLLEDRGLNYRFSLPNRIGDFAQAGVPLLATGFPEIARILTAYGIGRLVPPCPLDKSGDEYRHYVRTLAEQVVDTLCYWDSLPPHEREQRFARAAAELSWNHEKNALLDSLNAIFQPKHRSQQTE